MGRTEVLPREKDGLWLTEDNKLIMMHGNMTITVDLINAVLKANL